jgi:hypothetical protein
LLGAKGVSFVGHALLTLRTARCPSSILGVEEEDADATQARSSVTWHAENRQQLVAPAKRCDTPKTDRLETASGRRSRMFWRS